MMVQKRGAGSFDQSLNFSYPQNEENLRISRIAVYHCICAAPYMIRKGGGKGGGGEFPEHWLDLIMLSVANAIYPPPFGDFSSKLGGE